MVMQLSPEGPRVALVSFHSEWERPRSGQTVQLMLAGRAVRVIAMGGLQLWREAGGAGHKECSIVGTSGICACMVHETWKWRTLLAGLQQGEAGA